MSLIEVVVAVLVFAIIASGLVAGLVSIMRVTADARARIVATNLASEQLDQARVKNDPFQVSGQPSTPTVLDGRTFFVERRVKWVSAAGADLECSSSSTLFYLRVNVRVRWTGQLASTPDVQNDTLIAPSSRVTDASTGAISISAVTADGTPLQGIPVTITPKSGGAKTVTPAPGPTTAAGCTYATQVAPGTYTVKLTKAGYLDSEQRLNPTQDVTVTAGGTIAAPFQLDAQAQFALTTTTAGKPYAGTALLPSGLQTTFFNTGMASGQATSTFAASPVKLHPYQDGYGVAAGLGLSGASTCAAIDPAAWSAGVSGMTSLQTGERTYAYAGPGGSTSVAVPLGVVEVTVPAGRTIKATRYTGTVTGTPGCSIAGSYSWTSSGTKTSIALPFGTWQITANNVAVLPASLRTPTNAAGDLSGVGLGGLVTLDPRRAS